MVFLFELLQKIIKSRLMQINFELDNYIYKQIPISVENAKSYLREISSYKQHVYRDVRSLQVIEKQTRYIKRIIIEQRELENAKFKTTNMQDYAQLSEITEHNDRSANSSPVYSLPDIDKAYLSSIGTERQNEKVTIEENLPAIDLSEDIEVVQYENKEVKSQPLKSLVIQRPVLDLSLREIIDTPVLNATELAETIPVKDISQNILDNIANHGTSIETRTFESSSQSILSNPKSNYVLIPMRSDEDYSQSILINKETHVMSKKTRTFEDLYPRILVNDKNNGDPIEARTVENVSKPLLDNNENQGIQIETRSFVDLFQTILPNNKNKNVPVQTSSIEDDSQSILTNYSIVASNNLATHIEKSVIQHNSNKINRLPEVIPKCNMVTNKTIRPNFELSAPINKVPHKAKIQRRNNAKSNKGGTRKAKKTPKKPKSNPNKVKDIIKINNNSNEQNNYPTLKATKNNSSKLETFADLSWVEGIRFVRQISTSEYDSKMVISNESFWNNFTLPQDWNDQEFVYED